MILRLGQDPQKKETKSKSGASIDGRKLRK